MAEIILKHGREKSLLRRHPWIFSGAVDEVHGAPKIGEVVEVISANREFIARAAYNPISQITGRVWTWNEDEQVNPAFIESRINRSLDVRGNMASVISSNAMRLINGESDALPGLILDRYADTYVVQFLTAGIEYWKADTVDIIRSCTGCKLIYERSDADVRQLEGLPITNGILFGDTFSNPIEIIENDIKFLVDISEGHKTGFYLDQRENRHFARYISNGKNVLDCFAYTGGFALNCLVGKAAKISLVDSSGSALAAAQKNFQLNHKKLEGIEFIEQDVFKYLRTLRDKSESYDLIILDPPKFAPTASQADRAARGYKDINLLAFKILRPGGYLLTFSCSGGVSEDLFQKIIAGAALDAEVNAIILERLHQAADHPVSLNFPEGAYLKGFLIQKLD